MSLLPRWTGLALVLVGLAVAAAAGLAPPRLRAAALEETLELRKGVVAEPEPMKSDAALGGTLTAAPGSNTNGTPAPAASRNTSTTTSRKNTTTTTAAPTSRKNTTTTTHQITTTTTTTITQTTTLPHNTTPTPQDPQSFVIWQQFRRFANRSGLAPGITIGHPRLQWKFQTGSDVWSSPVLNNHSCFFGSIDGTLYAVDRETGESQWNFTTGGGVMASPALSPDGRFVYIGSYDTNLYKVDAAIGVEVWRVETRGEVLGSALVVNENVFFGSLDGILYAVDGAGKRIWQYATGDAIRSSPSYYNSIVYIGSDDGKLHAVDAVTGEALWTFQTGGEVWSTAAIDERLRTLYFGSKDYTLYALDLMSNKSKWNHSFGVYDGYGQSSPAVTAQGSVVFGSWDRNLYSFDAETGKVLWKYLTGDWVESSPAVDSYGNVYFGSYDNNIYGVNKNGEHIFSFSTDGDVFSSPAVFNDTIYVGSRDNSVYALDLGDKLSAISVGLIVTATVATAILVIIGGIAFYCQSRARRQAELYALLHGDNDQ